MKPVNRRDFLKASLLGGMAVTMPLGGNWSYFSREEKNSFRSRVGLSTGDHRAEMTFQALKPFSEQIKRAIGNKRILIKPNNVMIDRQLAATHVDTLEGILEFLTSIDETDLSLKNIVFGAPIKDPGFSWGRNRKKGARNDKPVAHGSGYRAINYNLFSFELLY